MEPSPKPPKAPEWMRKLPPEEKLALIHEATVMLLTNLVADNPSLIRDPNDIEINRTNS